jgi:voltage-gated potassium channel
VAVESSPDSVERREARRRMQLRSARWVKATEWPLTTVGVAYLVAYSVLILQRPQDGWFTFWNVVVIATWVVFVVDFFIGWGLADRKWHYLITHPIDFLVVITPTLPEFRVLRVISLLGVLERAAGRRLRGRVVTYAVVGSMMIVYVAALSELVSERDTPGSNIKTFGDALWWAITTITTVGYGDTYPVTPRGRVVAALLMVCGVALLGTVTATLASWLVRRVAAEDQQQAAATQAQVQRLETQIAELTTLVQQLRPTGSDPPRTR